MCACLSFLTPSRWLGLGHRAKSADEGKVYAFGRGRNGQLGRGDHVESVAAYRTLPVELTSLAGAVVTSVSAGENHSLATLKA
jgi:alpha-tubulin suppressor-like RCC1 family protein